MSSGLILSPAGPAEIVKDAYCEALQDDILDAWGRCSQAFHELRLASEPLAEEYGSIG